jgi:hypothetical protein
MSELNKRHVLLSLIAVTAILLILSTLIFIHHRFSNNTKLKSIQRIIELEEKKIDVIESKLKLEQISSENINIESILKKIEEMVQKIIILSDGRPQPYHIDTFLNKKGSWNDYLTYSYDHQNAENGSLHKYIETKKGNCVSMPLLFYAIAKRLNFDVYITRGPGHSLIKLKDSEGNFHNIETTSGLWMAPDSYFANKLGISETEIKNKIYLEPMTNKQTICNFANAYVVKLFRNEKRKDALYLSKVIERNCPNDITNRINKFKMHLSLYREYKNKHNISDAYAISLRENAIRSLEDAKNLGWIPKKQQGETI